MRRLLTLLMLLLALAACAGGSAQPEAARPEAASSAGAASPETPSPSPSPSPGALIIAAASGPGRLSLYAVAPGTHSATFVRRLEGPAAMEVGAVSLSAGTAPTVCAVWSGRPNDNGIAASALLCYRPGAVAGRLVARNARNVGVRADGRALAWGDGASNQALVVADLVGDSAVVRSRRRYAAGAPSTAGIPAGFADLDWIGARTLVVTDIGDSDDAKGLCVVDVDQPRRPDAIGFGRCLHPGPSEKGFARFEQAAPVAPGVVVAVERPMWCCDDAPRAPARAARVRLSDGSVIGVVATARPGRDVVDISGGSRAVLYTTVGQAQPRIVSLRWAGEAHGAPVTGLPAGVRLATAQP